MKRKVKESKVKAGKLFLVKHRAPHARRRKAHWNPKAMIHQGV